jgi:excisionase family DNA binding protein
MTAQYKKLTRWEMLHGYSIALPEGATLPPSLPAVLAEIDRAPAESLVVTPHDYYPLLRTRLRDLGLPFQATYKQLEAAEIIGVSDHTVRKWTRAGKMPCCRTPFGRPYYTAQNLEGHLRECEGLRSTKAAD